MTGRQSLRVAIYTRKSSEEGLEQEFNSLDAQREACEAYIASQRELGWKAMSARYDDGGLSGGSMERPALQQLLEDVRKRRIDVIVVYKIDRLTRSLMDFSRIVAVFDAHDVSFFSVTQQFNTATSMGRLTLNMLLSFAQFEREVTAERIRDKFAASKAKGMWMGGVVPMGYDVRERKLQINKGEAVSVRWLFRTYLELGSVIRLREAAENKGIRSKRRNYRSGKNLGGKPLTRGHLHAILANPIYAGKISYRGKIYEGQHAAIIDQETFDRVQAQLKDHTVHRRSSSNVPQPHLLTGIVFDETGDRLSPTHASKQRRRYRYYVSHRLIESHRKNGEGWRLPAGKLERIVIQQMVGFLNDRTALLDRIGLHGVDAAGSQKAFEAVDHLVEQLQSQNGDQTRTILQSLVHRITVSPETITIEINREGLTRYLPPSEEKCTPGDDLIAITAAIRLRRRGVETRFVLQLDSQATPDLDPALVRLISEAWHYREALMSDRYRTLGELAKTSGKTSNEISRILPLAFLAPDIVRKILEGSQPAELTAHALKRTRPLPIAWADQRKRLGFAAQV